MPPRQPVRIRPRRTPGDVLAGLGALVLLVALVGGVPYALLRLAGPPVPPELLDLDVLTSQVGTSTIIAILVLLVWLAWLQLTACVIVEVYAGIRRVGMPAQVPFSGGTQALANRLVSAALLLFTVSAVVVPIARPSGPPPRPPVAAAAADALSALPAPVSGEQRAPLAPVAKVKKVYVVQPPHGRHHESLWEIAEKCLGDGRRYPEVYRLNQHKEQPDGSRLHMADLIRPGWVLDMPDDARNVHVVPVDQPRDETLKDHPYKPAELDGRTQHVTPGTRDLPAGEETRTGRHAEVSPPQDTSVLPGDGSGDRRTGEGTVTTRPGDSGRAERPAPAETGRGTAEPSRTGERGTAEPSRTGERTDPARTGEHATGREHAPGDPGSGSATERPVPLTGPPSPRPGRRCSTTSPGPPCWRPGCWPHSAAGAGGSSGSGRSAAGSSGRATTPPRPRSRSGSGPTRRAAGCSTSGCGSSAGRSPSSGASRRPSTPRTCPRRPSTCGSTRRRRTPPPPGSPATGARSGGCPPRRAG
ncbi:hypothetical protein ACQP10_06025 [Streptosporangium sandarakinum]|uniref:LysM peptidoglycan-binding domain-containing protein n=1 Tax=Streptosporangium sandarakinum TaxID=1260955 RepID=UPI003D8E6D6D